jgi:hypothetical protein
MSCTLQAEVVKERQTRIRCDGVTNNRLEKLERNDQEISSDLEKEHKSRVEADNDLSRRIGKNFDRFCVLCDEQTHEDQSLQNQINNVSEGLEAGEKDYQNLGTRLDEVLVRLEMLEKSPDSGFQDADLRSDNKKLRVRVGILTKCNGRQARMLGEFRKLGKQMCNGELSSDESEVQMQRLL